MSLTNFITNILEDKLGITLPGWIYWIILIIAVFALLKWIYTKSIVPFVKTINDIELKLNKTDEIDKLRETQNKAIKNSIQKDEELHKEIEEVSNKVSVITDMLIKMQENTDSANRAKLKDRIRQSYSYYHSKKSWTKMEKESLEGLIDSYEAAKGTNSFVHTIVVPEMYTWEIIDKDDE